jgi:hypothetical protein
MTELDPSDVERRVGREAGGGELIDPCSAQELSSWGTPLVRLVVTTTNQDGAVLATSKVDVELRR